MEQKSGLEWKRGLILGGGALALLIGFGVAWWLASPLWRTDAVDEAFPFTVPSEGEIEVMTAAEAAEAAEGLMAEVMAAGMEEMSEGEVAEVEGALMMMAEKMPDREMAEAMPADVWEVARSGQFRDADQAHRGKGVATIYQQGEARVLRFEDFEVTNGPDLHVLLVENVTATNHDGLGAYVDLGSLKGNVGNQNYEIPADVDLDKYSGVMIYCQPFHVVFATADWD
ncbi:MAG TPA: DM13 domain-containing protein [Anaerolineae bacterium]|nr:DM13 domain-containing protein [Anaerolineae bacterium]